MMKKVFYDPGPSMDSSSSLIHTYSLYAKQGLSCIHAAPSTRRHVYKELISLTTCPRTLSRMIHDVLYITPFFLTTTLVVLFSHPEICRQSSSFDSTTHPINLILPSPKTMGNFDQISPPSTNVCEFASTQEKIYDQIKQYYISHIIRI